MKEKIVIIGNYIPDNQFSMAIYEMMMLDGYIDAKLDLAVNVIRPNIFFGKLFLKRKSLTKWLGYIDKFILFPFELLYIRLINIFFFNHVYFHIIDHSNAFYIHFLSNDRTIITCHDVLAIRSGLGYTDTYCATSKSGKLLQQIILNALSGAKKLAAVSDFTLDQLIAIDTKPTVKKKWTTIHNALSTKFGPATDNTVGELVQKFGFLEEKKFILHVGSDLERKNRKLLVKMIHDLRSEWEGILVLAGAPLGNEILKLINDLNVGDLIFHINRPSDSEIISLYTVCHVFIFPSFSEGFGWPIIEAQACGAPVITSNKAPMMSEVGGVAALYADPDEASSFIDQFRKLNCIQFRSDVIHLGYVNTKRFSFETAMSQYINLIFK